MGREWELIFWDMTSFVMSNEQYVHLNSTAPLYLNEILEDEDVQTSRIWINA